MAATGVRLSKTRTRGTFLQDRTRRPTRRCEIEPAMRYPATTMFRSFLYNPPRPRCATRCQRIAHRLRYEAGTDRRWILHLGPNRRCIRDTASVAAASSES